MLFILLRVSMYYRHCFHYSVVMFEIIIDKWTNVILKLLICLDNYGKSPMKPYVHLMWLLKSSRTEQVTFISECTQQILIC